MTLSRGATRETVVQPHRDSPCKTTSKQDKASLCLLRAAFSSLAGSLSSFCAEEMDERFSAPVCELPPSLQRFAVTVEKSWQGTGHIRSTCIKYHHHLLFSVSAVQRNNRGVCVQDPRLRHPAWQKQQQKCWKWLTFPPPIRFIAHPCFTAPSQPHHRLPAGVLQPPAGRSCCPALLCPSLGMSPTHKALRGELGRNSRLRRTCLRPACRKPVLTRVPQGRTQGGWRSRGAPLSPGPTAGYWAVCKSTPW